MSTPEFIDTYSDDIMYLRLARTALLTHPLRRESKAFCDPAFSRMFAIMMIGGIDMMLEAWKDRDKIGVLEAYFSSRANNGARVTALFDAFTSAGVTVSRDVFDDYLAIKYLRNTIVHARWKDYEREWMEQRGFPVDSRQLTSTHWGKIQHVNQNMMMYIALTAVGRPVRPSPLIHVQAPPDDDTTGIFRLADIHQMIWLNLERISSHIHDQLERVATAPQYWESNANRKPESLREAKERFYLAARRASEDEFAPIVQVRRLAREALAFWKEYRRLTFDDRGIEHDHIVAANSVIETFLKRHGQSQAAERSAGLLTDDAQPHATSDVARALEIGRTLYDILPNITPVTLLLLQLPIVDHQNTDVYFGEGRRVLEEFRLRVSWYSFVESAGDGDEVDWQFYDRICDAFVARRA